MNESEVSKVFGFPDASWLRAWKMIDAQLKKRDSGLTKAQLKRGVINKQLCQSIIDIIQEDKSHVVERIQNNEFEVAHAFTNELLELMKILRVSCEPRLPAAIRRRMPPSAPPKPPKPTPKAPKPKKARKITKAQIAKLIPTARKMTKAEQKAIEDFLKVDEEEVVTPVVVIPPPEAQPIRIAVEKPELSAPDRKQLATKISALKGADKLLLSFIKPRISEEGILDVEGKEEELASLKSNLADKLLDVLIGYDQMKKMGMEIPLGGRKGSTRYDKAVVEAADTMTIFEDFPNVNLVSVTESEKIRLLIDAINMASLS